MSAPRTNMHRLQQLVRLHRKGLSLRRCSRQLKMGRNTARDYLKILARAGLLEGPAGELPALHELQVAVQSELPAAAPPQQTSSVAMWSDQIKEMASKGAMPRAIYDALRLEEGEFNGSYDAVKRYWRRLQRAAPPRQEDVAIPVFTDPGQVAQVDFFEIPKVFDPAHGRKRRCWAFVMLLAHSRHMFVDLVFDQRAETWQKLHAKAFVFFGGVPQVIVPDNLKAAVIRAAFDSSGEIALNRSYEEIAQYYGFMIDPAPAYQPKKKGKVERSGKYFRSNYIKPRLGQDIVELRSGIRNWVMEIAGTRLHGTTGRQPVEVFESEELPAMLPCPAMPFSQVIWHQAKVHADSHLQFRSRLYSVPWAHLHKRLWLRATETSVVVYAENERVATHRRQDGRGRSTEPGHLPERREQWGHQTRAYWEEQAATMGEEVFTYVLELFDAEDVLLPLRKVQAIVSFLQDYPKERRVAACERARFFGVTGVRAFKDILRKGHDSEPLPNAIIRRHGELDAPRFARGAATYNTSTPTPEA